MVELKKHFLPKYRGFKQRYIIGVAKFCWVGQQILQKNLNEFLANSIEHHAFKLLFIHKKGKKVKLLSHV